MHLVNALAKTSMVLLARITTGYTYVDENSSTLWNVKHACLFSRFAENLCNVYVLELIMHIKYPLCWKLLIKSSKKGEYALSEVSSISRLMRRSK